MASPQETDGCDNLAFEVSTMKNKTCKVWTVLCIIIIISEAFRQKLHSLLPEVGVTAASIQKFTSNLKAFHSA